MTLDDFIKQMERDVAATDMALRKAEEEEAAASRGDKRKEMDEQKERLFKAIKLKMVMGIYKVSKAKAAEIISENAEARAKAREEDKESETADCQNKRGNGRKKFRRPRACPSKEPF